MWWLPAEESVDVGPSVAVCGDGDVTFVGVNLELAVRDECRGFFEERDVVVPIASAGDDQCGCPDRKLTGGEVESVFALDCRDQVGGRDLITENSGAGDPPDGVGENAGARHEPGQCDGPGASDMASAKFGGDFGLHISPDRPRQQAALINTSRRSVSGCSDANCWAMHVVRPLHASHFRMADLTDRHFDETSTTRGDLERHAVTERSALPSRVIVLPSCQKPSSQIGWRRYGWLQTSTGMVVRLTLLGR
jgi:hypothetical protein